MSLGLARGAALAFEGTPATPEAAPATERATAALGVPFTRLRAWNAAMFCLHAALCAATLVVGNVRLAIPLYATETTFEVNTNRSANEPAFYLRPAYRETSFPLRLTMCVAFFFFISATAHLGNVALWRAYYEREVASCRCTPRWVEYAASASVMIVAIAVSVGVREYTLLLSLCALTATTMSFGLLTEYGAVARDADGWTTPARHRLLPHVLGYVPQLSTWACLLAGFYDQEATSPGAPAFVHAIVWTQAALFASFGAVQLVQQLSAPRHYWKGELAYQVMSAASKGTLGLLILANVLVLSDVSEAFE